MAATIGKSRSLPARQVRQLTNVMAIVRWAGLGWLGIVGLVVPPPAPAGLAALILWVAAYNGWVMVANHRAAEASVVRIGRIVTVLDQVTYFAFLALFLDSTRSTQYNVYTFVLIEAIAYDGVRGAVSSVFIFIAGFTCFEAVRTGLFRLTFPAGDVVVSNLIILVAGGILTAVNHILLSARSPEAAIADTLPNGGVNAPEDGGTQSVRLSVREMEVLRLVAEGYSNAMIAAQLHLSESTVKTHVESLLARLNVRNRAEAVASAARQHIL